MLTLEEVNEWLRENYKDHPHFSEEEMKKTYLQNKIVKTNIKTLEDVLKKNNVTNRQIGNIVRSYFENLVPEEIKVDVKEKVLDFIIGRTICREGKNKDCDWYVKDQNEDIILGFNYPHLFIGEKQIQKIKRNVYREERTINVLCNFYQFKEEDKLFEVIRHGIMKGNICYYDKISEYIQRIN